MGDRRKSPSRRTFKGRARRKRCRVDQDHEVSFCACWGRRSNEIFDNAHLGNARPDAGADGVHGRSAATEYSTTAYVGGGISPRGELTKPVLPGGFFFAQQNGPSARLTAEAVVWGVSCGGHDAESATRQPEKRSGHIHISGLVDIIPKCRNPTRHPPLVKAPPGDPHQAGLFVICTRCRR
jgi:hypothetical protein